MFFSYIAIDRSHRACSTCLGPGISIAVFNSLGPMCSIKAAEPAPEEPEERHFEDLLQYFIMFNV